MITIIKLSKNDVGILFVIICAHLYVLLLLCFFNFVRLFILIIFNVFLATICMVIKLCINNSPSYKSMSVCEIRGGQEGSDPPKSMRDPCKVVICRDPGGPIKTPSLLTA